MKGTLRKLSRLYTPYTCYLVKHYVVLIFSIIAYLCEIQHEKLSYTIQFLKRIPKSIT